MPVTLCDPKPTQNTPFSTFCVAFNIFVVSEYGDIKFGLPANHVKSEGPHANQQRGRGN